MVTVAHDPCTMPYRCDLGPGHSIYLDNQGNATIILVSSTGAGQQQQASNTVHTGPWTDVPQVAQVGNGVLIRCVSAQGVVMVQVQGSQIGLATSAAAWASGQTIAVQPTDHMPVPKMRPMEPMQPMEPMEPMQPMQPMRMGNMQMSANPMAMRMGNMEMQMGNTEATPKGQRQFCTQCGASVSPEDRFCGNCGHQLK